MNHPELFSKFNFMSKAAAVKYLDKYAGRLSWRSQNESIIDLGCGDGAVSNIIKKYVPTQDVKFVASDVSEKMIQYAKKKYAKENIIFKVLDIQGDLPNDLKHNFNHVVSIFALHFVHNQEKAFKNVFDLLKEDGDCFMCFLKRIPYYDMYVYASQMNKWKSWIPDVKKKISPYYFDSIEDTENKVSKLMKSAGFTNIEVKCDHIKHVMKDGTEFVNLMRAVEPFNMPDDVFEDFANDNIPLAHEMGILARTSNSFRSHEKPIDYNYEVILAYGTKP